MRELFADLMKKAREGGAAYADARLVTLRRRSIEAREGRLTKKADTTSRGVGVRALYKGSWGFACTSDTTPDSLRGCVAAALDAAKASMAHLSGATEVHAVPAAEDEWQTPISKDAFAVPMERAAALLLDANARALRVRGIKYATSGMHFAREEKLYASTDGSFIAQTICRSWPYMTVTAVDPAAGDFETRSLESPPAQRGYEHAEAAFAPEAIERIAAEANEKFRAPFVKPGKHDLVILPSNLWLTIHESIGHSTEYDRILGLEANMAGTSFVKASDVGKLKFGPPLLNFIADRTETFALATAAYDDDGVRCGSFDLIREGVLSDLQYSRAEASRLGKKSSPGLSYADSWASMPFQRMPNISLEPVRKGPSFQEIVGDTKEGLLVSGSGSWSIDQQRYNFQFGAGLVREIKNGKVGAVVRGAAYQANTLDFWGACDAAGGCEERKIFGSLYDGKGEPMQFNAVSHGCPPARFRKINVLAVGAK
ncbi:MAG: TldD/PmbA family protein [Deltaproteobacteria bacterium]|nr:TldD/PmbA family protein [Deltaproteobacteria bacterium]